MPCARIDWEYLLGLPLTDPGFHFTVLHGFRTRLMEGQKEAYALRAGVESTPGRAIRVGDLRHGRSIGSPRAHVQQIIIIAVAVKHLDFGHCALDVLPAHSGNRDTASE